jgi:hypothetical protein
MALYFTCQGETKQTPSLEPSRNHPMTKSHMQAYGFQSKVGSPCTCEDESLFAALELVGGNFNGGPSHPLFREKQHFGWFSFCA